VEPVNPSPDGRSSDQGEVDTAELRKTLRTEFLLKNQRRRGGVGLQQKKSSSTRTEGAPEQVNIQQKKSSKSRTGRAPVIELQKKREGGNLSTHLLLYILL